MRAMTDDDLRTRIAAVQLGHMPDDYERDLGQCRCGFKYQKHWDLASHVADAVIAELRPQLAAWAQTCVDSGDMTPAAQRELHKILGSKHDRH